MHPFSMDVIEQDEEQMLIQQYQDMMNDDKVHKNAAAFKFAGHRDNQGPN